MAELLSRVMSICGLEHHISPIGIAADLIRPDRGSASASVGGCPGHAQGLGELQDMTDV